MTDGYTICQLALDYRTDRLESPHSSKRASNKAFSAQLQSLIDATNTGDCEPDYLNGTSADPADPSAAKPKATNPAQRNFNASQRLPNVADANNLFTNQGYETVRVVGIDWGKRYLYGASSMLVNVEDKTYTMESNYVLASGMARAEHSLQRWYACNDSATCTLDQINSQCLPLVPGSTIDMPRQPTSRRPLHSRQQSMPIQTSSLAREPFGICAAMRTACHS
ncbi:hypothetical protein BC831DRAFT_72191 [Entophlyctis helioformis]|nr:hypothetical protein BC831DRAFT_72191 [Entophlyctis helioformis]